MIRCTKQQPLSTTDHRNERIDVLAFSIERLTLKTPRHQSVKSDDPLY